MHRKDYMTTIHLITNNRIKSQVIRFPFCITFSKTVFPSITFYAPFSEVFEVITRKTLVVVFQRRPKYRRSEL